MHTRVDAHPHTLLYANFHFTLEWPICGEVSEVGGVGFPWGGADWKCPEVVSLLPQGREVVG